MSEKKVPEVRFRGFSGEWECKLFSEVFDTAIPNNTLSRANLNYENGEVKNIHYGDILIKFGEITNVKKSNIPFITDLDITKYKGHFLVDGDVIFADTAEDDTVGKATEITGIGEEKVVSGLHTIPVRPHNLKPVGYCGYYINSHSYHKQLLALMQGIKVLSISKRSLANTSVSYPLLDDEQAKIGKFFKNLDDLIAQNQKKYDKLVNMKKACLDKMFPEDGADTPEVRVRGFSGKWEQRALGEIANLLTGYPFKSKLFAKNGVKLIRGMNVKRNFLDLSEEICEYWNSYTGLEEYLLKAKDILIQMDGALIGMSYARIEENQLPALLVQRVTRVRSNDNVDNDFIFQAIQKSFLQYILGLKTETAVPHLSLNDIRDFRIKIPVYDEQRKISRCLQTLDNLITLQKTKLEKLKNIKKACLDKMFI